MQNLLFTGLITGDLEPVFHVAGGSGSERAIKKIFGDLCLYFSPALCAITTEQQLQVRRFSLDMPSKFTDTETVRVLRIPVPVPKQCFLPHFLSITSKRGIYSVRIIKYNHKTIFIFF